MTAHIEKRSIGYVVRMIPGEDEGMELGPPARALTKKGARRKAKRWLKVFNPPDTSSSTVEAITLD
jgi:hypothetical protein